MLSLLLQQSNLTNAARHATATSASFNTFAISSSVPNEAILPITFELFADFQTFINTHLSYIHCCYCVNPFEFAISLTTVVPIIPVPKTTICKVITPYQYSRSNE